MLTEKNTSDKYKYCEFCGRTLPKHYEGTLCPTCQEAQLFRNVRDYIRANTVNEYEVAEHFHIPLRQIKDNYPKYVITLDTLPMSENGIRQINAVDFLLQET